MARAGSALEVDRARIEKGVGNENQLGTNGFSGGGQGGGFGAAGVPATPVAIANGAVATAVDTKALTERLSRSNSTLRKLGAGQNNTVYVVVCADDTNAAAGQVRDYFTNNGIPWQPLPPDNVTAISAGTIALHTDEDKAGEAKSDLKKEAVQEPAVASKTSDVYDKDYGQKIQPRSSPMDDTRKSESANAAAPPPPAPQQSTPPAPGQGGDNLGQLQQRQFQQQAANYSTNNYGDTGAAGNRNAYKENTTNAQSVGAAANDQAAQQQLAKAPAASQLNIEGNGANREMATATLADTSDAFVATGLTRRAAEQLSATLSTQRLGQTAAIVAPPDVLALNAPTAQFDFAGATNATTAAPTTWPSQSLAFAKDASTQPTTAPALAALPQGHGIQKDDHLTVTVDQLVGPGVDKTNTVRVAGDGTISLPMIEPVPAAGQTPTELEKQIAQTYRRANLIPDPTVTVRREPTTQPATTQQTMDAEATTRPAGDAMSIATTQPLADAAERVDVVVLVQKNSSVLATPTTEPAAAAAATQPIEAK
jgi:hypothetical protein